MEQIGSVYETMMGFRLETAVGRFAAIRSAKRHGAPATVNLDALLDQPKSFQGQDDSFAAFIGEEWKRRGT